MTSHPHSDRPATADVIQWSVVEGALNEVLAGTQLVTVATIDDLGQPQLSTAFFAALDDFTLVFVTSPNSRHARNAAARGFCSVSVADAALRWGGPVRGATLTGQLRQAHGPRLAFALAAYARRFLGSGLLPTPDRVALQARGKRIFLFTPDRIEVVNETRMRGPVTLVRSCDTFRIHSDSEKGNSHA